MLSFVPLLGNRSSTLLCKMSRKNAKREEFDGFTIDNLADKIKAKILKSIREMTREELPGLIKSVIKEEVTTLIGKVRKLSQENIRLKTTIALIES